MIGRSLWFMLSTRALESPWTSAAWIRVLCLRMVRASLTNAGSFDRDAHASHSSSSVMACSAVSWWNALRSCSYPVQAL